MEGFRCLSNGVDALPVQNVQNSLSVKYKWSSVRSQPLMPTQWRSPRQRWKKIQPWTKDRGKWLKEPCVMRDSNNNIITIWRCVPRKGSNWNISADLGFQGRSCSIAKYKMCPWWTFRFCVCTAWSVSTHVLMIVCFISAISRWWYGISFCLKLWQNKRLEKKMRTRCYWSQGVRSFHLDVVQFNNACHRKSTCASVTGLTVFFFFSFLKVVGQVKICTVCPILCWMTFSVRKQKTAFR